MKKKQLASKLHFKEGKGWRAYAATMRGKTHKINDDAFFIMPMEEGIVAAVCDGVSGARHGRKASHAVVHRIEEKEEWILKQARKGWRAGENLLEDARSAIKKGETTIILAVIDLENGKHHVWNVGDGHGYLIRGKRERILTEEHTPRLFYPDPYEGGYKRSKLKVKLWDVKKTAENCGEMQNIILSCLQPGNKKIGIISYNGRTDIHKNNKLLKPLTVRKNDIFLLTTDGLSDYIDYCLKNEERDISEGPNILQDIRRKILIENNPEYMLELMEKANAFKGDDATFVAVVLDKI